MREVEVWGNPIHCDQAWEPYLSISFIDFCLDSPLPVVFSGVAQTKVPPPISGGRSTTIGLLAWINLANLSFSTLSSWPGLGFAGSKEANVPVGGFHESQVGSDRQVSPSLTTPHAARFPRENITAPPKSALRVKRRRLVSLCAPL